MSIRPNQFFRPSIEVLEGRSLPAAVTASLVAGDLRIQGTPGSDGITVRQSNDQLTVIGNGAIVASVNVSKVSRIDIYGMGGNDRIDLNSGQAPGEQPLLIPANVFGGSGNSTLIAGSGHDMLYAGGTGTATLIGGAGQDTLYGGTGNDLLLAGSGNTLMYSGAGNATLIGGPGSDTLVGGPGTDWLEPHSATSVVHGGTGLNIDPYEWSVGGTKPTDIQQQGTNSCVLLAELASASAQGVDLTDRISYLGNYVFQVKLFDSESNTWVNVDVTFNGTLAQANGQLFDPAPITVDPATGVRAFWPLLYQRAYLQYFYGINPMDTTALNNFSGELFHDQAAAAVTGWSTTTSFWDSGTSMSKLAQQMQGFLAHGDVLTVGGTGHAFAVLNVFQVNGTWRVTLYNPYGNNTNTVIPLAIDPNGVNNGVLTMDFATLYNSFVMYNRAINPN